MDGTVASWLDLTRQELDDLYMAAQPGPIPQGDTQGTPIVWFLPFKREVARIASKFIWQGKCFKVSSDEKTAHLSNKVSPFGAKFIDAHVYFGESWLDGNQTIVIDYSTTSLLAHKVRDEIRQITPGHYLGKVWWGKRRVLDFALQASRGVVKTSTKDCFAA